jgi:hypothetical protein
VLLWLGPPRTGTRESQVEPTRSWCSSSRTVRCVAARVTPPRNAGTRASCQLEAQVDVPSVGFFWKSDPLETSKCDFAIIGDEVNGRYYDA